MSPSTKTIDDFPVGTKVEFNLDGIDVHGTVESIQLAKKLVDVKIYEPGHRQHCLIVARAPETLYEAGEGPSSYADLQKRVEGTTHETLGDLQGAISRLLTRIETLEHEQNILVDSIANLQQRMNAVENLHGAVQSLQTRMDGVQANVTKLLEPDGGQAASA